MLMNNCKDCVLRMNEAYFLKWLSFCKWTDYTEIEKSNFVIQFSILDNFLLVYCVYKNSEVSLLYYSLNKNLFIFGLLIHTTIFYFKRQSGVYIIRIPEFYWSHCWVPSLTYTIVALNSLHEPHMICL